MKYSSKEFNLLYYLGVIDNLSSSDYSFDTSPEISDVPYSANVIVRILPFWFFFLIKEFPLLKSSGRSYVLAPITGIFKITSDVLFYVNDGQSLYETYDWYSLGEDY